MNILSEFGKNFFKILGIIALVLLGVTVLFAPAVGVVALTKYTDNPWCFVLVVPAAAWMFAGFKTLDEHG